MSDKVIAVATIQHGMNCRDFYEVLSFEDGTYQKFRNKNALGPRTTVRPTNLKVIGGFIHKPLPLQEGEIWRKEMLPYVKVGFKDGKAQIFKNGERFSQKFPCNVEEKSYVELGYFI